MGEHITLTAPDGHQLDAYVAHPTAAPIAGLVVIQEAFGVNSHIRSVTDSFAADGFLAIAPALFDRVQRGVELGYTPDDLQQGIALARQGNPDNYVNDVAAAIDYVRDATGKKVGVIGYCLGGSIAWLAAARLDPEAVVGYYGGYITKFAEEKPKAPIMLHFGLLDTHIPKEEIDSKVAAVYPDIPIFWYDAGHGFSCNDRASYNPAAAQLARARSLDFIRQHLIA